MINLYRLEDLTKEYPLFVSFIGENAIDEGGVSRDMFSAFWNEAFSRLFEGATLLVPLLHASTDMGIFPILGG